jgi:hypothetical protein
MAWRYGRIQKMLSIGSVITLSHKKLLTEDVTISFSGDFE